jgi:D-alanyl-lipoteichoic acid acyltransferase DltB (MBOAT superfamily)
VSYLSGVWIEKIRQTDKQTGFIRNPAKWVATANVILNLGILCIFKYFNFFSENLSKLFDLFGYELDWFTLDVLLPVGISFYTFQALSYTIDVYKHKIEPTKDLVAFLAFVSFFPQLVAGPIERATNLLPQFYVKRKFVVESVVAGLKTMLWGYFMKLCVADRLSTYVDPVFNNYSMHSSSSLLVAAIMFSFQIYCDFAGYSLIAIGTAKILGFNLMNNFRRPFLSRSIKEFWNRWHISLSTWLRDYVYIPMGGSRVSLSKHLRNLMITFIISGMWHGANWTFFTWGFIHGVYLIIGVLKNKFLPKIEINYVIRNIMNIAITFLLVVFAFIFFRAENITQGFEILKRIFTSQGTLFFDNVVFTFGLCSLAILVIKEIFEEYTSISLIHSKYAIVRYITVIILVCYVILVGVFDGGQFIYFQF